MDDKILPENKLNLENEPWSGQIWAQEPISEQVKILEQSGMTWINLPVEEIEKLSYRVVDKNDPVPANTPLSGSDLLDIPDIDNSENIINSYSNQVEKTLVESESACCTGSMSSPENDIPFNPDKMILPPPSPPPTGQLPRVGEKVKMGSGVTVSIVGQGGMGRIYKIWNEKLEVHRAVKILFLPQGMENTPEADLLKKRIEMEAKIVAQLHHPNIVDVHNFGEWNGLPYLEMEFVDGIDVKSIVKRGVRISFETAAAISILVCRGLTYAHQQTYQLYGKSYEGVVHRDLKPENIMITRRGNVKILDFGIARPDIGVFHTTQGHFAGSLQYAAPEQIDGGEIDMRADIYSFGLVMYEMFSGKMAFPIFTMTELLATRMRNEFVPVEKACRDLPKSLSRIVGKCLRLKKEDRFSTADDLLVALEDATARMFSQKPEVIIASFLKNREVANKLNG